VFQPTVIAESFKVIYIHAVILYHEEQRKIILYFRGLQYHKV
jgi:hypothetical protein